MSDRDVWITAPEQYGSHRQTTRTDDEGVLILKDDGELAAHNWLLQIPGVGWAHLPHERATAGREVVVHPGGALEGKALRPDGSPVAGLELWVRSGPRIEPDDSPPTTFTSEGGLFAFTDLPPGLYELDGHCSGMEAPTISIVPGEVARAEVLVLGEAGRNRVKERYVMAPRFRISGVVSRGGRPWANARAYIDICVPFMEGLLLRGPFEVSPEGEFSVVCEFPSRHTITILCDESTAYVFTVNTADIGESDPCVTFESRPIAVTGVVRDAATGKPVSDAEVYALPQELQGSLGLYEIPSELRWNPLCNTLDI